MTAAPSLHFAGGWYWFKSSYADRNLPAAAGFTYHPATKMWRTRNPFAAMEMERFANAEASAEIARQRELYARDVANYTGTPV